MSTASSFYRLAGLSYVRYANLCAEVLRASLKEPFLAKARLPVACPRAAHAVEQRRALRAAHPSRAGRRGAARGPTDEHTLRSFGRRSTCGAPLNPVRRAGQGA